MNYGRHKTMLSTLSLASAQLTHSELDAGAEERMRKYVEQMIEERKLSLEDVGIKEHLNYEDLPPRSLRAGQVRAEPRPSRNTPCPCGSGLKYKRCCLNRTPDPTNQPL